SNIGGPGDASAGIQATGSLQVFWGSDNADTTDGSRQDGAGDNATASSAALTGRALYFTDATVGMTGANGAITTLTSRGEEVSFRVVDDGTQLEGYIASSGRIVFDVTLSDDGAGSD